MRLPDLWRTTPFRLTLANGVLFAAGVVAVLGLMYAQVSGYIEHQMDDIVVSQGAALAKASPDDLPKLIEQAVASDQRAVEYYGLFSADGVFIAGNVHTLPRNVAVDGKPHELRQAGFQPGARALVERMPWGELVFVGHDAKVLTGLRTIIVQALLLSGGLIITLGLAIAAAVSLSPLRRIEQLRIAAGAAAQGVGVRLPLSRRNDEMDMLARLANAMMDDAERLLWEVKSVGDNVAHDLRTPLNRLRANLYRLSQEPKLDPANREMVDEALNETDEVLARFRALLRIGEIERRDRQAGFGPVRLQEVMQHAFELYEPLAEDRGVALKLELKADAPQIMADRELMFEAVSNLVDNALKFTPAGGQVALRLARKPSGAVIEVIDNGVGLAEAEREAVLQRFYRAQRTRHAPGSGLGLSIVAAVARLHHFTLSLGDAGPGLKVSLDCWPRELAG